MQGHGLLDMTSNTILIAGGGCGIGRGLAEAFPRLGNHVVIAGCRTSTPDRVTPIPGMRSIQLDIESCNHKTASENQGAWVTCM
jgi:uncharacterized oxidoreductase